MVKQWSKLQLLCLQFNFWLNLFLLALLTLRSASICSSISLIDRAYILPIISVFTEIQWLHVRLRLQEIGVSKTLLLELSVYQSYEDQTISLKWHSCLCIQVCLFAKGARLLTCIQFVSTVVSRTVFDITAAYSAPWSYAAFLLFSLIPSKVY